MAKKRKVLDAATDDPAKVLNSESPFHVTVSPLSPVEAGATVVVADLRDATISARDEQIKALTAKVEKLSGLVRQSVADLSFLAKTTHSEYAQRREKEARAEFGEG